MSPGRVLRAGVLAAVFSGVPSTVHALVHGSDPLGATYAAGRLLRPDAEDRAELLLAAALAHLGLALGWTAGLSRVRRPRPGLLAGAGAGLVIAGLDLGLARRLGGPRFAAINRLPVGPQVADHVAFGALVGLSLRRGRR